MPEKPLIERSVWEKAVKLNNSLKEAVMNPNTDFMTKLLFDARFFVKKAGRDVPYWSNTIFGLKFTLREKDGSVKQVAKAVGVAEEDVRDVLSYLKNMGEVLESGGKYSLNYTNIYSKPFGGKEATKNST